MEQEIMKPCPFCGGEAKAFYCEESGTFDVQCQQCGAIPFIGSRTSEKKTMADVIAAWNARAAVTDEQFAMVVLCFIVFAVAALACMTAWALVRPLLSPLIDAWIDWFERRTGC